MNLTKKFGGLMLLLGSFLHASNGDETMMKPTGLEWEQEQNLDYNKEPARAYFASFDSLKNALKILPENSKRWKCLDGNWLFNWSKNPSERPVNFYKTNFNAKSWDKISVPSSWQTQGYGIPVYSNQPNIFPNNWPYVMTEPPKNWTMYEHRNPVGSYITDFTAPKDFDSQSCFIQFDGVESFFYIWVNGKYVGFSKDSRNVASFNVGKYLKPGKNKLAVEVYRNSDGSYLECQDMFRLSGIFRSVWFYTLPKVHIQDFFAITTPTDKNNMNGKWKLHVDFDIKNDNSVYEKTEGYTAEMSIYNEKNELVKPLPAPNQYEGFTEKKLRLSGIKNFKAEFIAFYENPLLWSAEKPNLYTLIIEVKNAEGKVVEYVSHQLGFRHIEIKNSFFYVNNQPIKLKGVNRHETTPDLGHQVPREMQFKDIQLMKQANINHVRNSHYPTDFYFYFLANKYGIYIQDEANIESHSYYYGKESLSHPAEWKDAHVYRISNMIERNKNNPSIIMWSLGNEAGPGRNFSIAERVLKARDNSRPTHYERNNNIVDLGSNQYPSVDWVWGMANNKDYPKPYYISEYAHNMNNAMGNLADYQDAIESSNRIVGGAIWDWVDQGLYKKLPNGKTIIGYGGDWNDAPNSGQFVMNGCIFADRQVQPGWYEIKHVFQNVKIKDAGNGKIEINNKNYFTDLSDLELNWALLEDGKLWKKGKIDLPEVKPMQKVLVNYPPMSREAGKPGAEYMMTFEFKLKTDKDWAEKGYTIATDQIPFNAYTRPAIPFKPEPAKIEMTEKIDTITFTGKNFKITFNKLSGTLTGYEVKGVQYFKSPIDINAFRCATSNDGDGILNRWLGNGLRKIQQQSTKFEVKKTSSNGFVIQTSTIAQGVAVEYADRFGGNNTELKTREDKLNEMHTHFNVNGNWEIFPDGTVAFHSVILPRGNVIDLPRIGVEFELNPTLTNLQYYGAGFFENYPDRKSGAHLGLYSTTVKNMFTAYARPMDCGNREDTRFFALTDNQGNGLQFAYLNNPFAFSALPYSATDFIKHNHPASLPEKTDKTVVVIASATRGLGGASCGPGPIARDIIKANKPFPLAFTIRPINKNSQLGAITLPDVELDQTMQTANKKLAIKYVSSQEPSDPIENVIDNDSSSIWHSQYGVTVSKYPHWFDVEVKTEKSVKGIAILGRNNGANGRIKGYEISISQDGKNWVKIKEGELKNNADWQNILFDKPLKPKYIQFKGLNEYSGQDFASLAEFKIIEE